MSPFKLNAISLAIRPTGKDFMNRCLDVGNVKTNLDTDQFLDSTSVYCLFCGCSSEFSNLGVSQFCTNLCPNSLFIIIIVPIFFFSVGKIILLGGQFRAMGRF